MPGTKGKSCVICEKKSVDTSLPQGLTCTYCGAYFHSSCSDTFSAVSPENLGIIKDVCTPCPNCEHSLRHLPARVAALETKFDEFVIRIEAAVTKAEPAVTKAAPVQHASQVDIAIKEAISANDNRYNVVFRGYRRLNLLVLKHTKEIVSSLDIGDDVVFVDAYRLGKRAPDGNRPRLLKVRFASSLHRSLKAKSLKNSPKYSKVYIRPCHSPAERKHISELNSALHDLKQKTGKDHYIDRRGPIKEWSVKMRIEKELSSATVESS
eukprot:Em0001g2040a